MVGVLFVAPPIEKGKLLFPAPCNWLGADVERAIVENGSMLVDGAEGALSFVYNEDNDPRRFPEGCCGAAEP